MQQQIKMENYAIEILPAIFKSWYLELFYEPADQNESAMSLILSIKETLKARYKKKRH